MTQDDPQVSMPKYLRPFDNFERIYQGKDGTRPIAFPGVLDVFAQTGVQGYDPNLLAGVSVPYGSRITIWIPQTIAGYTVNANYSYQIMWRLRSVGDFREGVKLGTTSELQTYSNYHLPVTQLGQPEATTLNPNANFERYFLPGATRIVAYEQSEPAGGAPATINLHGERIFPAINPVWSASPLTPTGADAIWQQGTYVGSSHANTGGPSWVPFSCDAEGDEISILAFKVDPGNDWDFTTAGPTGDLAFSNTYGSNNGQNQPSKQTAILLFTSAS